MANWNEYHGVNCIMPTSASSHPAIMLQTNKQAYSSHTAALPFSNHNGG